MVFITAAFSYTNVLYSNPESLKIPCGEKNHNLHNMSDIDLDHLLNDLNELRSGLSHDDIDLKTSSYNLKWVNTCTGAVMVEMKSRKFEKNFQKH